MTFYGKALCAFVRIFPYLLGFSVVIWAFMQSDPPFMEERFLQTDGSQMITIKALTPEVLEREIEARKTEWQVRDRYEAAKLNSYRYRANLVPIATQSP